MSELITNLKNVIVNYDNANAYQVLEELILVCGKKKVFGAIEEIVERQSTRAGSDDFRLEQLESRMSAIERTLGLRE